MEAFKAKDAALLFLRISRIDNSFWELEVSHQVKADRAAYKAKTQQAINEFLSITIDNFISSLN
jgi:hypothetical protein